MKSIRLLCSLLCCAILSAPVAFADEAASTDSVRKLMVASGAGELGVQVFAQMLPHLRRAAPNAPDSFWEDVAAEIDSKQLVDLVVPIYQRHFSESEIQDLITFYQSSVGRKFVEKQAFIMTESMTAGQQWGETIAREVLRKARAAEKAAQVEKPADD